MKKEKDYSLTLICCIVFFAVLANLPACYQTQEHEPAEIRQPQPAPPVTLRPIQTQYVCPDCREWGCIYGEIDDCTEGETDQDIENAIQFVCKRMEIS